MSFACVLLKVIPFFSHQNQHISSNIIVQSNKFFAIRKIFILNSLVMNIAINFSLFSFH